MNDTKPTVDELPKSLIAKAVVSKKRLYFFPHDGVSLEADSTEEAIAEKVKTKQVKAGDE